MRDIFPNIKTDMLKVFFPSFKVNKRLKTLFCVTWNKGFNTRERK